MGVPKAEKLTGLRPGKIYGAFTGRFRRSKFAGRCFRARVWMRFFRSLTRRAEEETIDLFVLVGNRAGQFPRVSLRTLFAFVTVCNCCCSAPWVFRRATTETISAKPRMMVRAVWIVRIYSYTLLASSAVGRWSVGRAHQT
jgi:hypothetical protein